MKIEKISYMREDSVLVIGPYQIPLDALKATANFAFMLAIIVLAYVEGQNGMINNVKMTSYLINRGCGAEQIGNSITWSCPNTTISIPPLALIQNRTQ
jgi:hypothetical protein